MKIGKRKRWCVKILGLINFYTISRFYNLFVLCGNATILGTYKLLPTYLYVKCLIVK